MTSLVRRELAAARTAIKNGGKAPEATTLAAAVVEYAHDLWLPRPQPVINATGVVIHTNLGRAPLSSEALQAIHSAAEGYSDLEYDPKDFSRLIQIVLEAPSEKISTYLICSVIRII